jgi:HEAT repeat protein
MSFATRTTTDAPTRHTVASEHSAVPQLLQALNDPSAKVRKDVVNVPGEMGNPKVVDRIAGLQADPDFGVRWAVEGALAKIKATKH